MKASQLSCAVVILLCVSARANAQLRPLEPIQWRLFETHSTIAAEIGGSRLEDQRASLAGTRGDLTEIGSFAFAWKTGRIVLEAAGTAQRLYREHELLEDPYPDVDPADDGRRNDSGDYRLATSVRLTPSWWPATGVLRFGTRLPTTDNTTGLDRDAIDFFATVGLATQRGPFSLGGEAGLGIHTTRETRFEQDDLLLYALRAEMRSGIFHPSAAILGQMHGTTHSAIRGVENLGELRLGLRVGGRRWVRAEIVKGYERFSPERGLIVSAGMLQ